MMSHNIPCSRRRWPRRVRTLFALMVAVLFSVPDAARAAQPDAQAAIPATTKVLTDATTRYLSMSGDGAVLIFSQSTQETAGLVPGDVVVSGVSPAAQYGFLRKVLTVSTVNGAVIVTTRPAFLHEAIHEGTVRVSGPLSRDKLQGVALAPGVTLADTPQALLDTGLIELRFDATLFDQDEDPNTTHDRVTATGRANLHGWVDLGIDIGASTADFSVNFEKTTELRIDAPIANGNLQEKVTVATFYFEPWGVLVGGVFPLVFVPVLTVEVGFDGSVHEGILVGVTQTSTVTAGLHYANGTITPVTPFTNGFSNRIYPILYGDVDLKAFAGPRAALLLYGIGGLYGDVWTEIDAYLRMHAERGVEPWWTLYGGLEASAGFRLFGPENTTGPIPLVETELADSGTDPQDDYCTDPRNFRLDNRHPRLWGGMDYSEDRDWASVEAPARTKMLLALNPVGEAEDTNENYDLELWVPPVEPRTAGADCTTQLGASSKDPTYRYRLVDVDGNVISEHAPIGAWGDERILVDVNPDQEYRSKVAGHTPDDFVSFNPLLPLEANYLLTASFGSMNDAFQILKKDVTFNRTRTADAPFGVITVQMTVGNVTAAEFRNVTFLVRQLDANHKLLSAEVHSRTHGPVWLLLDVDNPAVRGPGATVSVPNMAFCYDDIEPSSMCLLQEKGNTNSSGFPDDRFEIRFRIGAQAKEPLSSFWADIYASPMWQVER